MVHIYWCLDIICNLGHHANDSEHQLMKDLFDGYNKDSRPVFNKSKAVNVELDVAYSQLVDLVRLNKIHPSQWFEFSMSRVGVSYQSYLLLIN